MKYQIAIAEDHTLVSNSLKKLIDGLGDYEVKWQLKHGEEVIDLLKTNSPDLILMDIKMPVLGGIDTMKWISENRPDQNVLALSVEDDERVIITMIKLGSKGYLLKNSNPTVFKNALSHGVRGIIYHTEELNQALLKNTLDKENSNLNDRELEFLKYVCSEMTYKEIAAKMFLSPKTIDGYRENLFKKLKVKSRIGLVLYAIREGVFKL